VSDKKPKSGPDTEAPDGEPKLLRNLKPKLAPPDHPIYKLGFAVGGTRLVGLKEDPKGKTGKK
jgi:hypothetical protein